MRILAKLPNHGITLQPKWIDAYSNLQLIEQNRSGYSIERLFKFHCQLEKPHASAYYASSPWYDNARNPKKQIGCVSYLPVRKTVNVRFDNLFELTDRAAKNQTMLFAPQNQGRSYSDNIIRMPDRWLS